MLGPFTVLYRPFLKRRTLTIKAVGTIRWALSKPPQRRQGPDSLSPLIVSWDSFSLWTWARVQTARSTAYLNGCPYIFLIFYDSLCTNFFTSSFLCPRIEWSGAYCFCPACLSVCLFVCLSVVNFNIRYNFWTIRGRDCIFGMHTPLMIPVQMTPRSMNLWPWLWPFR